MVEAEAGNLATADDWILEYGVTVLFKRGEDVSIIDPEFDDENNNRIHDFFEEASHVHVEDEL